MKMSVEHQAQNFEWKVKKTMAKSILISFWIVLILVVIHFFFLKDIALSWALGTSSILAVHLYGFVRWASYVHALVFELILHRGEDLDRGMKVLRTQRDMNNLLHRRIDFCLKRVADVSQK